MSQEITRRQFVKGAASAAVLTVLSGCARHLSGTASAPPAASDAAPPQLLLDALHHEDVVIQADAARLLGDLGSRQAVGPLCDYAATSPRYVKTAALDALARIGDDRARRTLRPLVDEPRVSDDFWWYGHSSVRTGAVLALMALGDDSRAKFLIECEDDHLNWVLFTWFGPTALRLPDRSATRALKARFTVEELKPDKSDPGQVIMVCDSLGLLGTEAAHDALIGLLGHMSRYVRGRAAINLLGHYGRDADVQRVERVAARDDAMFARVKAAQALAAIGHRRYVEPIAQAVMLADDPFDRAAALDSLGLVGGNEHVDLIAAQTTDDDAYVRLCAVEALDRIGTDRAVAAAAARADDPDLRVQLQAAKTLAAHRA
ncbi:MAG: HEAT repeat domain-containing protein [Planctomycetes bacterium]|nr:HEAT repeat domain-containing protein [Planctomycetota bacterium]